MSPSGRSVHPVNSPFSKGGGEMGERIRTFKWSRTPLGPPDNWSPALQTTLRIMLANRFPHILWWGPEYIQFYNDPYIPIPGAKHPKRALGRPAKECWSEIWHVIGPLIDRPFQGGPAAWDEDILLEVHRHDFVEETHFTIAYSPVPDENAPGGIGGVLATVHEITGKVVGDRRVLLLRDLRARSAEARTAQEACAVAARTLEGNARDIPFALLYLIEPDRKQAHLAGCAGAAPGQPISPAAISLEEFDRVDAWPFPEVLRTDKARLVMNLADRFGEPLPPGPWSEPPHTAAVVPIRSNRAHYLAGFLVAGISSRLRFDAQYGDFLDLVSSQIATGIANAREYEEEKKRVEALAEIDRAKTVFFSNVSHEFRTPLTLMLGPIEDLLSRSHTELPPAAAGQLELAHRNSRRLLKLVNTLLDFSRIEAGRMQAFFEPTDLAAFTAELASMFRAATERAGLSLVVDCPKLAEPVYVDRDMWEKIVLNLVSNAFKFTMEGAIEVSLRSEHSMAVLRVRDTGVGISAEEMPRLFERFHRIQSQQSRTHEGSGIGLALVQELIRLHGGAVCAESRPGEGTTFLVTLPLGKDHLPVERIGAGSIYAATSSGASPYVEEAMRWLPDEGSTELAVEPLPEQDLPPVPFPPREAAEARPRILVADDNADMRQYVTRLLAEHYDVAAVPDGRKALQAAHERRPDLVLADVMMPNLDGLGLVRELRADSSLKTVPIILLSARACEESRVEGMQHGADDYVIKPFSGRELVARVAAHLEMTRIRKEASEQLREAEGRFRALVTATSNTVYRMSPDWKTMLYLRGRDFIANTDKPGATWLQKYVHPDDQQRVTAVIQQAIRTKSPFELEHRVLRVDGTLGWAFSRAVPIRNEQGEIVEWFGAASDITKRKRAEDELRASAQQFQAVIDGSPGIVFVKDLEGRFIATNRTMEVLLGLDKEEVRGKTDYEIFPKPQAEQYRQQHRKVAESGASLQVEEVMDLADGRKRVFLANKFPLCDAAGKIYAVCSIASDITERKQADERMQQSQKLESVGLLAGGVAHDFNNLLIGVIGNASLIQETLPQDHPASELVNSILETGEKLAHLTRQMLAYAGKGQFFLETLDLSAVVHENQDLIRTTVPKKIDVQFDLEQNLPSIEADRGQMHQVLMNLVINAAEAIGNHEGLITVRTGMRSVEDSSLGLHSDAAELDPGEYVLLEISDTGCGMDDSIRARIFDPFFSTKFTGRGLGLAAVSGIVRSHKGGIGVNSRAGKGSRFTVLLPASARIAPDPPPVTGSEAAAKGSGVILVIDDEGVVRETARKALEHNGYTVLVAESGLKAIDIFKRHSSRIDLAVLDLSMPAMSGDEILPELNKIRPEVKVIVSSGYSEAETMRMFQGQKVRGFVQKPYTAATIVEKVRRALACKPAQ